MKVTYQKDYILIHTAGKISNYYNSLIEIKEIYILTIELNPLKVMMVGAVKVASAWQEY
jgi:hypothetical protein